MKRRAKIERTRKRQNSFVVGAIGSICDWYLKTLAPGEKIVRFFPEPKSDKSRGSFDRTIDVIVIARLGFAIAVYTVASVQDQGREYSWLIAAYIVIAFGLLSIFEIVAFHTNRMLRRPGRPGGIITEASYERSLVLLALNYAEVIIWFAIFYAIFWRLGILQIDWPQTFVLLRESTMMMVANSSGSLRLVAFSASNTYAHYSALFVSLLFLLHNVVGIFMTIALASRAISLLRSPGLDRRKTDSKK